MTLGNIKLKSSRKRVKNKPHKDFVGFYLFLAAQGIFYLWLMKDLRPTYDQNAQKQGKPGNFCKKWHFGAFFTQPRLERTRRFSVFLPYPAQKFPTKITGNFSEPNRELSANNRETVIEKDKLLDFLYLIRYNIKKRN